jgi:hypothetical protein
MRIFSIILALILTVLAALTVGLDILQPSYPALTRTILLSLIAAWSVLLLVAILLDRRRGAPAPADVKAPAPAAPPPIENRHDAEVINFLAILQEKGRLVDFLMDDITGYSDAQVGAAARVMHEGCKAALMEHFGIKPMRDEGEGAKITVPTGYAPDDYRLVGKIAGQPPFTGTLVHHGWRADWVKLPRLLRTSPDRRPAIAPAEVELT